MSNMTDKLDIILEDNFYSSYNHDTAMNLVRELHVLEQRKLDIEHSLSKLQYSMVADLALAIRRLEPGFNIAVSKTGCKVGYKTKHLMLCPDFKNSIWDVSSTKERFLKEFLSRYKNALLLDHDLKIIGQAVVDHFVSYFRSLEEEITDTGVILVDDVRSTLFNLVEWKDTNSNLKRKRNLPSRVSRLC